jgi:hypothetical protein
MTKRYSTPFSVPSLRDYARPQREPYSVLLKTMRVIGHCRVVICKIYLLSSIAPVSADLRRSFARSPRPQLGFILAAMDINPRLYVEIHPLTAGQIPHPHPIDEARFDPTYIYKVLGMYNPSETSECYMILANTQRQIWFIPQRHLLAHSLLDSDEFFIPLDKSAVTRNGHNGHSGRLDQQRIT